MTSFKAIRTVFFRLVALTLVALSAVFTFPENHYYVEKTFVKSPAPQTEVCSLLAEDDIEDSNDFSTGAHFFSDFLISQSEFLFPDVGLSNTLKVTPVPVDDEVYLRIRQLLI